MRHALGLLSSTSCLALRQRPGGDPVFVYALDKSREPYSILRRELAAFYRDTRRTSRLVALCAQGTIRGVVEHLDEELLGELLGTEP